LASGLERRWWHHAIFYPELSSKYQVFTPFPLRPAPPRTFNDQYQTGCLCFQRLWGYSLRLEGSSWLHRRAYQRQNAARHGKFDGHGEPAIFVRYPTNQREFRYVVHGVVRVVQLTKIIASYNIVFGRRCPRSPLSPVEAHTDIPLAGTPSTLSLQMVFI
jgi:hypothetical protein